MAGSTLDLSEIKASVGRLIMCGIPGTHLDKGTEDLIRSCGIGGIILFSRNIEDPVQLASLSNALQKKALQHLGAPLFLAVDQEGGRVARLKAPFREFPGNTSIGEDSDPEARAKEFAHVTATEMKLVGLNMNLAPVVDVPVGEVEDHLRGRVFSHDPLKAGSLGGTVVKVLQKNGIMAVAKHFPGLGATLRDPHHELPFINVGAADMEKTHLAPFREAVRCGVCGVMTSHALYSAHDPDRPATLSRPIMEGILRDKLGFQGLILTDDLEMGAIKKKWGVAGGALASLRAGADLLLICKDQTAVRESIDLITREVIRGDVSLERLQRSGKRVEKAKDAYLKHMQPAPIEEVKRHFSL